MNVPPAPMFAVAGELPADDRGWAYEFKWDGMRCIAHRKADSLVLHNRTARDVTALYPELGPMIEALPPDTVVDGEIVALDHNSRPDLGLMQKRMNLNEPSVTADLVGHVPVNFFGFDLLRFDGRDLTGLAWHKRRGFLEEIDFNGPSWRVPPVFEGDGAAILEAASRLGLEGIMAKRAEAIYLPGIRASAWRKIKLVDGDEFVVAGHT
ncbi:MAG: hypothetical protein GY708_17870 [Actinomycetia bacterium]|nr:hypothetical protein [Actinomycetes bacterium]